MFIGAGDSARSEMPALRGAFAASDLIDAADARGRADLGVETCVLVGGSTLTARFTQIGGTPRPLSKTRSISRVAAPFDLGTGEP